MPDAAFLEGLAELCQQTGTCLILDEIQSGYGRSGRFFAYQYANIAPDLITMAKGMGNGFPIGGVLIHPRHKAVYGMLGTTFGGSHLACAAGIAVLDVLEAEQLIPHAAALGDHLMPQLAQLPGVLEVRGRGLMIGIQMGEPVAALRKQLLFEASIFTGSASDPNTIRLLPPLNVTQVETDALMRGFEDLKI